MNGTTASSRGRLLLRGLTALMWAALPVNGILYAASWSALPQHLATHFDINGHPNGWMSPQESLLFSLVLSGVIAAVGTFAMWRFHSPDLAAWGVLAFFYVILWTMVWANISIIRYNLEQQPVSVVPVVVVSICAVIGIAVLILATHRGRQLSAGAVLADETHASPFGATLLAIPAVACVVMMLRMPEVGPRVAFGAAVIVMLFATAMAGSGFHYSFSPAGVEIRTLGFRLRSIPAADIRSYGVGGWNWLGGYGIRGIGDRRAYVWGNRGVRIRTTQGEVFLGHSDPERIIRDLNLVEASSRANSGGRNYGQEGTPGGE